MRWRVIGLASVVLVLAGCSAVNSRMTPFLTQLDKAPRYSLSANETKAIKASVLSRLKDPESATFGKQIAAKDSNGWILVCGSVNAKNSFGGFIGMQPYYVYIIDGQINRLTLSEDLDYLHMKLDPCPI